MVLQWYILSQSPRDCTTEKAVLCSPYEFIARTSAVSSTALFPFILAKLRTKNDHVPIKHTKHYGKLDREVSILC